MNNKAKILIACEESGTVTHEFIKNGFINTWSCDLLPTSGQYPLRHIQEDVRGILLEPWDLIIAFPPCTDLAVSGARWFPEKRADGRQQASIDFFMLFANHPCPKIAIENPVGIMSSKWRKPNFICNPWWFGDSYTKSTCFWTKGLPNLVPTNIVAKGESKMWRMGPSPDRAKLRSKTPQGLADAIASQWGKLL